jgi:hypothetical protein
MGRALAGHRTRALVARSRPLLIAFAVIDSLVLAGLLIAIFVLHWDVFKL